MEIIAVANEKGGVAKTTTTISLGGALVEQGFEVLMVDLDTQANLTLGLGLVPARIRRSIADVLMNSASLLSVSRETSIPGLDVVPSNSGMSLAERFLPMRQGYEYLLKNALTNLPAYDFVLLDCPPSLGAVTYNALTASNRVIAPTQPEYFSAYGLRSVMAAIRRVRGTGSQTGQSGQNPGGGNGASTKPEDNPGASADQEKSSNPDSAAAAAQQSPWGTNPDLIYHILITMMDRRNRIHRTLSEQLRATFGEGLLNTVIETDTKLRESSVAGLPITHYYPNSRSAGQYRLLAEEIRQYAKQTSTAN